jgi:NAD(P)-dependent dehydrogenase (short-subunit alcohol dehydrogenase family)
MTDHKVWLITGCSTGFGRELAQIAAQHGDQVVGTLRQDEQAEAFDYLVPEHTLGVKLDVTQPEQIAAGIRQTLDRHGRIDVLVNNAGYGSLGALEEVPDEEIRKQFDVNVFGAINMIKAVLPTLRKQRSGHILNITSIAGIQGYPGVGAYNASKFALEGIGESLAADVKHLGIKVINVEPGPFRTDWAGRSATYTQSQIDDYAESAGKNLRSLEQVSGHQPGDPVKAAQAMYDVVQLDNPPMHLPLGGPAYRRVRTKLQDFLRELDEFEHLGLPTDYTEEELAEMDRN